MYFYCSIIERLLSPQCDITFNDENFYKQNINEIIYNVHQKIFSSQEVTYTYNMERELNKLNLYSLLARLIIMLYKSKKDTSMHDLIIEKYSFLNSIFENRFFSDMNKELFLSDFSKIQRSYFALSKFARMYKYKKSCVKINTDLYMNELNDNMVNVFVLYEYDARYFFSASDLVNIINSSLSHTYNFFSEPLKPKNPYNNLPFNKSTLYNIYFFMKKCRFIMPQLFEQYFICNFDIKLFKYENECLIRDFSIKRYIYSSNYDTLYDNVIVMIEELKKRNKKYKHFMIIDDEFPQKELVDIMRPYLHLYYLSKYYVTGTDKKNESMRKLINKFDLFVRFNPQFGRKIIKIQKIPKKIVTIEYNDKHMNFYKQYPKSIFPPLPTIVDIKNTENDYNSQVPSYENIFEDSSYTIASINRPTGVYYNINAIDNEDSRTESIFSSTDEELDENEEEVEEDTTDGSDSVS